MDEEGSIAVCEFQEWFEHHKEDSSENLLFLVEHKQLRSGGTRLDLCFSGGGETFLIICPEGYPEAQGSPFQLRTEEAGLKDWSRLMENFINENHGQVKLTGVLTRAMETYANRKSLNVSADLPNVDEDYDFQKMDCDEASDVDDDIDDDDLEEEEFFTTDWEIQMDLRKKKWLKKEGELRAKWADERKRLEQNIDLPKPAFASRLLNYKYAAQVEAEVVQPKEGQQIFDHESAAFQILANEAIHLLQNGHEDGFTVDTVDDSLYTWNAKIGNFPEDSKLYHDLRELKSKYGYNYVELQLDFVPDFPFYPPLLRVVRPRFKGSLVQSLANMELLKLTYWNPAKSVLDVLRQIKDILLEHARVDVDAARNDARVHPEGGYLPLEDHLIKLALATEVRPRATYEIINVENLEKAPQLKRKLNERTPTQETPAKTVTGWAKGTGYGTSYQKGKGAQWSPEDWVKAKREKDRQILRILKNILDDLEHINEQIQDESELYAVIEGSALISYLENELNQPSFIEISRHLERYRLLMELISKLGEKRELLRLMCPLAHQEKCLMLLLQSLSETAAKYLNQLDRFEATSSNANPAKSTETADPSPKLLAKSKAKQKIGYAIGSLIGWTEKSGSSASEEKLKEQEDTEKKNAEQIVEVFDKLQIQLAIFDLTYQSEMTQSSSSSSLSSRERRPGPPASAEELEELYKSELGESQFQQYSDVGTVPSTDHKFYKERTDSLPTRAVRAIFKEWTALRQSLPLNLASSVFVKYDEQQVSLLQALIIGPEGTPYANGCFLFDIFFPSQFPQVPPKVLLCTTGGGKVRFNPNLYNCGKVCLSLLGTWAGDKGETWTPTTSTLLQVLVSIQSLIMIDDPFFNEPGYERTRGTPEGDKQSQNYNKEIRNHCVHWAILDMLKNPPAAFSHVIKTHFRLKKEIVKKQLDEWKSKDSRLDDSVKKVKDQLAKL